MDFYQDDLFKSLVVQILNEPFAVTHGFDEKDLFTACELILETQNVPATKMESFEKTRSLVSLLLCHLDLERVADFPSGALGGFVKTEVSAELAFKALMKIEKALEDAKADLVHTSNPKFEGKKAA